MNLNVNSGSTEGRAYNSRLPLPLPKLPFCLVRNGTPRVDGRVTC